MNQHHASMLRALRRYKSKERHQNFGESYIGSTHPFYGVSVPLRRGIVTEWLRSKYAELSARDIKAVTDSLFHGTSHEEKTMGAYLLGYRKDVRAIVTTRDLDRWLGELVGWAEIDALCQNIFTADELLAHWDTWQTFLITLSKSKNINKRRASLVFLTGPTSRSSETQLHALAYETIDRLKHEKDILITKAISWLLRCMIDTHKPEVAAYIDGNADTLPKIAVRETRRKLLTGKKND